MNQNTLIVTPEFIDRVLSDFDLEMTLSSPSGEYSVTYSTSIVAKDAVEPFKFSRSYWLTIKSNQSVMTSQWDDFDHFKQVKLVMGLLQFSNYKISALANGWTIECPRCKTYYEGKIWRNSPKKCDGTLQIVHGCGLEFGAIDKKARVIDTRGQLFK